MVLGMLKTLLVTTLLVSAVAAPPVWGQITRIGSIVITPAQSDEYVIQELVSLYRRTPATYAQTLAFLQAQRPYLVDRFNKLTLKGPAPRASNPPTAAGTAPVAAGGTAASRTTRPQPAGTAEKPTTATVYDGQTALQNNGLFIALGVLGLAAAAGAVEAEMMAARQDPCRARRNTLKRRNTNRTPGLRRSMHRRAMRLEGRART
jgi:hypothetical protein